VRFDQAFSAKGFEFFKRMDEILTISEQYSAESKEPMLLEQ
jgi:hypothetical protein